MATLASAPGAEAAGQQIVGILQKMMKEVSETIQQASEQLGQVEVSRTPGFTSPQTIQADRCRAGAYRVQR